MVRYTDSEGCGHSHFAVENICIDLMDDKKKSHNTAGLTKYTLLYVWFQRNVHSTGELVPGSLD